MILVSHRHLKNLSPTVLDRNCEESPKWRKAGCKQEISLESFSVSQSQYLLGELCLLLSVV